MRRRAAHAVGSLSMRGFFAMRAGRFRLLQPRPSDAPTLLREGIDPIRVLITGAGLAAGYGVTKHELTMAGSLADRLARSTGRGVRVDVRVAPLLRAADAVALIGPNGSHTYDAAVFAPCFLEGTVAPGTGMERHAREIEAHLRTTGNPRLQIVLLGMPGSERTTKLDRAATRAATTTNRALQAQASRSAAVAYVEPPAFDSVRSDRPFTAEYYERLGHDVADSLSGRYQRV